MLFAQHVMNKDYILNGIQELIDIDCGSIKGCDIVITSSTIMWMLNSK